MRIALLLPGFIRMYENHEYVRKFIENNPDHQFDVFIHTWDVVGLPYKYVRQQNYGDKLDLAKVHETFCPLEIAVECLEDEELEKHLLLKNFCEENSISHPAMRLAPSLFQHLKIWKCLQMAINYSHEHDFEYDLVIKSRPDLATYQINLSEEFDVQKLSLYKQKFVKYPYLIWDDKLAVSGPQTMMKIYQYASSVDEYIKFYLQVYLDFPQRIAKIFSPHHLLLQFTLSSEISINHRDDLHILVNRTTKFQPKTRRS